VAVSLFTGRRAAQVQGTRFQWLLDTRDVSVPCAVRGEHAAVGDAPPCVQDEPLAEEPLAADEAVSDGNEPSEGEI